MSLSQDGPWLPHGPGGGAQLEVHDLGGPRLRILDRRYGIELWLYTDPATLQEVALEGAELRPGTGHGVRDARDPGFTLEPGTSFQQIAPSAEQRRKVKTRLVWLGQGMQPAQELQLTGYVDTGAVGKVYRLPTPAPDPTFTYDVSLPIRFELRDVPGGQVFAVAANRERLDAVALDSARGWVLVRTLHGVVGWIAASQVRNRERPVVAPAIKLFSRWRGEGPPPGSETLPIGTPLHDAIDGRVVGTVAAGFYQDPVKQDGGWQRFDIATLYGTLALWAHATAKPMKTLRDHIVK